jgi:hypothetical protein
MLVAMRGMQSAGTAVKHKPGVENPPRAAARWRYLSVFNIRSSAAYGI